MDYKEQAADGRRKLLDLDKQIQELQKERETLKQYVEVCDRMAEMHGSAKAELVPTRIGFTEAIRVVLGNHLNGLTPMQIKAELQRYGVQCGSDRNFLSNIHKVIKRTKEIESLEEDGRKIYKLKNK